MHSTNAKLFCRRRLLRFLAASPLIGYPDLLASSDEPKVSPAPASPASPAVAPVTPERILKRPEDGISVFEFEAAARQALPPAHWGYLATGVDGEVTLQANRDGFAKLAIRPRRLVDVTDVDMSTQLFGVKWKTPIILAPIGSHRTYHGEGELATAMAARERAHLMILSTVSTTSVEDVNVAMGQPVWFQLYPTSNWNITQALLRRAETARCPVVVLTADLPTGKGRKTETFERMKRIDPRRCADCHEPGVQAYARRRPMLENLDFSGMTMASLAAPGLTWETLEKVRSATAMKVVVKGILTAEDARLCVEHGADGIIVSNHGGRADDSGLASIEALPEVVEAVRGRCPVLVDSGFRRGADIFKALALGAQAVCIGRPYIWGLAAFGQPGTQRVLEILSSELELTMRHSGTRTVKEITPAYVRRLS
jgi:4-hydroxymandelate oxidase